MATVEVYTKAKSDEIFNSTVIAGEIDGSNHLILTTRDATEIDAGTFTVPDSSVTVKGIVELATDAETVTGSDTARATTPAGVAAALSAALATFVAALDLNDLTDVDVASAANGNFLRRSGGNWGGADVVSICTSGTRPATPYQGQFAFETDTLSLVVCVNATGPAWRRVFIVGQARWQNQMLFENFASSDGIINVQLAPGDTQPSFRFEAGGKFEWGVGGTTAVDTNLYRSAADKLATDDDFLINAAGKGLRIKEGSNAKMGVSTLVAGTVVVSNTSVTANSRIFLMCETPGGTPGFLRVSARTASTSFTILSSSGTDTSVVGWLIIEPA